MISSVIVDPFEINHSDTNVRRTKNLWSAWSKEEANIIANSVGTCWPEEFTSITERILEKSYSIKLDVCVCVCVIVSLSALSPSVIFRPSVCLSVTNSSNTQTDGKKLD